MGFFRQYPPRVMEIKAKLNKWDLIKSFWTAKESTKKVKRQLSEWDKIIANDNKLISKIYNITYMWNLNKSSFV